MYLKRCDDYVSRVFCPAFLDFGYAPWKAEVEEMYGSDLERSTEKGGQAPVQNARVRPGGGDVTTKSEASTSAARGRRKSRATQARILARGAKPIEVCKTLHRYSGWLTAKVLTEACPRLCRVRKGRAVVLRTCRHEVRLLCNCQKKVRIPNGYVPLHM